MKGPGPVWAYGGLRLEKRFFRHEDAPAFYRGYRSVMDRTPVRLETYPRAFFEALASSGLGAFLLRLENQPVTQSITALLIPSGSTLSFVLVAKERARYDDALYALLLQCIVVHAVQDGFRTLRLGQTSGYSKRAVGAEPARLEAFLRMRSSLKQRLLARVGPLLFPESPSRELHVFRNGAAGPSPARAHASAESK